MSDQDRTPFALPEGRGINLHLFVRQVYKDPRTGQEGNPNYSVEMAYPKPGEGETDILDPLEAYCMDVLREQFGGEKVNQYLENGWVRIPIKDGDKKAARREANGKAGDAYKGMWIISSSTQFNWQGNADAGGIDVFDHDVNMVNANGNVIEVDENGQRIITERKSVAPYNGCMGIIAVKGKGYEGTSDGGDPYIGVVLYLEAFQMTGPGERLASAPNRAGLFQKRPNSGGATGGGRTARG